MGTPNLTPDSSDQTPAAPHGGDGKMSRRGFLQALGIGAGAAALAACGPALPAACDVADPMKEIAPGTISDLKYTLTTNSDGTDNLAVDYTVNGLKDVLAKTTECIPVGQRPRFVVRGTYKPAGKGGRSTIPEYQTELTADGTFNTNVTITGRDPSAPMNVWVDMITPAGQLLLHTQETKVM